jgi:hypothetical protein
MKGNVLMFVSSLLVVGAMALTLLWFFQRLRRIEEQRWGKES